MTVSRLQSDSPALYSFFLKTLPRPQLIMLEKAYQIAAESPSCHFEYKQRLPGASFNPQPARILEILSKNAGVTELKDLISALAAISPESMPQLKSIAMNLEITNVIEQAVLLDSIRHLNFTEEPESKFKQLEYRWNNLRSESDLNKDLTVKIDNAIHMYGRRYQSQTA